MAGGPDACGPQGSSPLQQPAAAAAAMNGVSYAAGAAGQPERVTGLDKLLVFSHYIVFPVSKADASTGSVSDACSIFDVAMCLGPK